MSVDLLEFQTRFITLEEYYEYMWNLTTWYKVAPKTINVLVKK